MKKILLSLVLFLSLVHFSYAEAEVFITDAWVREVPPVATVSAAYLTIENKGDMADKLMAISSDAAENVEIHMSSVDENGLAKMEMIKILELPSGEKVELKPGGMHFMLIGLKEPLVRKESVNLILSFEKAKEINIQVPIKSMKNSGEAYHH